MRKKTVVVAAVAMACFAPSAEAGTLTFTPTDDARVEEVNPNTNYGPHNLKAKGSTTNPPCGSPAACMHSYLLFNVLLGANEKVGSAALKMTPVSPSVAGFQTYGADSDFWDEGSIAWAHWSRPAATTSGGVSGPTSCTTTDCVSADVTNLVDWNGNLVTIVLKSSNYFEALSKEDGAGVAPKLVVETVPYSDTSPPTAPSAWGASFDATQTSAEISWSPSTDNVRVAGYNIYLNGVLNKVHSGSGSMMGDTITGLTCGSSYTATLRAVDPSGNLSTPSNDIAVQTNQCGVYLNELFTGTNGAVWVSEDAFWDNEADGPNKDGVAENSRWFAESGELTIASNKGKVREDYFRVWTRDDTFLDVKVTLDLTVHGLPTLREKEPPGSGIFEPAVWDGAKLWLRRQLCTPDPDPQPCSRFDDDSGLQKGYTVEFALRSNQVYIQKRAAECPEEGYLRISPVVNRTIPFDQMRNVGGTVKNNANGSVTIRLLINGAEVTKAIDSGSCGIAPFTEPGRVGLRGDNIDMTVDKLVVRAF